MPNDIESAATPSVEPKPKTAAEAEAVEEIRRAGKSQTQHVETGPHGDDAHGRDLAQDLIKQAGGRIDFPEEEGIRVRKKIDRLLMPLMIVIYFLQFFDKQGLAFSSTYGLQTQLNLVGKDYSWTSSIVYFSWILFNPIGAYFLVKLRLSIAIPVLVGTWGVIMLCSAAVKNFAGLIVSRFFLGGMEACIAPAFVFVGQTWYKRSEQPWRIALWYGQTAVINIFGSLIAWGFGHITSDKLYFYQILFIFLGALTLLFAIFAFFVFPESPADNKFLTEDEKLIAVERLRANQQGTRSYDFKWSQALGTFLDLKAWLWLALCFLISVPSGGISSFGPLILETFGFDGKTVLLLNMPFGFVQGFAIFFCTWISTRFRTKSIVILALMLPCLVGSGLLYGLGRSSSDTAGLLVAYYILAFYVPVTPLLMSWYSNNTAGSSRRTVTTAMATCGQAAGNIVGPLLFSSTDAPYYHSGLQAILIIFCLFTGLMCVMIFWLTLLNKRNERRRVAEGKPAKLPDYSMMSAAEVEKSKREIAEKRAEVMGTDEVEFQLGEHAFEDMTDLENNEFTYVY